MGGVLALRFGKHDRRPVRRVRFIYEVDGVKVCEETLTVEPGAGIRWLDARAVLDLSLGLVVRADVRDAR